MSHRFDSGNSALGVLGGSAGLSDEAFLVVNVRRTNLGEVGSLALPGLTLPGLALPRPHPPRFGGRSELGAPGISWDRLNYQQIE
jgi:hypothetical protein